jgi:hypothetical protein
MTSKEEVYRSEIVIPGQELVDIFSSRQFNDEVFGLADRMVEGRSDYLSEMGFYYLRYLTEPKYEVVHEEGDDRNSIRLGVQSGRSFRGLVEDGYFPLVYTHFHTPLMSDVYQSFDYGYSYSDLKGHYLMRKFMNMELGYDYSMLFNLSLAMGKEVSMTLLQETAYSSISHELFRQYDKDAQSSKSRKSVFRLLRGYGYIAEQVVYGRDGLSEEDQEVLRSFEIVLEPIDLEGEKKKILEELSAEIDSLE